MAPAVSFAPSESVPLGSQAVSTPVFKSARRPGRRSGPARPASKPASSGSQTFQDQRTMIRGTSPDYHCSTTRLRPLAAITTTRARARPSVPHRAAESARGRSRVRPAPPPQGTSSTGPQMSLLQPPMPVSGLQPIMYSSIQEMKPSPAMTGACRGGGPRRNRRRQSWRLALYCDSRSSPVAGGRRRDPSTVFSKK